jgi:hypothetical protein
MKANRKHWLLALLLILGISISAQENTGNREPLFAPLIVRMDVDKESFLIGTLDDYMGHQQTFTAGRDSSNQMITTMKESNNPLLQQVMESADWNYQCVDHYSPQKKNLALLIQALFGDEFPDLYMVDPGDEITVIRLHSASLAEVINGYYDYEPHGSHMTLFFDTVYAGILKPERFQTVRQKLSFLAGAFLRDGYQTEERGYHLSMPNSLGKAKLCTALLNEFDCTNVVHEVFKGYIPTGNIVCFEPSETIRTLIEWVKTMKESLKSDEITRMNDLTVDTVIPVAETHLVNRHPPTGRTDEARMPAQQTGDKKIKIPSATVHAIKPKMQELTDKEGKINVPASESRTDVKPFNKIQPRQGYLLENETPKELLPP